jgi:hypothetical protein
MSVVAGVGAFFFLTSIILFLVDIKIKVRFEVQYMLCITVYMSKVTECFWKITVILAYHV